VPPNVKSLIDMLMGMNPTMKLAGLCNKLFEQHGVPKAMEPAIAHYFYKGSKARKAAHIIFRMKMGVRLLLSLVIWASFVVSASSMQSAACASSSISLWIDWSEEKLNTLSTLEHHRPYVCVQIWSD
jgi:hypothetical protein